MSVRRGRSGGRLAGRIAASSSVLVAFALLLGCRGTVDADATAAATVPACAPAPTGDAACSDGSPVPTGELAPALPPPDLPTTNRQGYRFRIEATLTADLRRVPSEAPVYELSRREPTVEEAESLAVALDIDGAVEERDGGAYVVSGDGELYVSSEMTQYLAPARAGGGPLPSDDEAVTLASDWLRKTRFAPAGIGRGRVMSRIEEAGRVVVVFGPAEPERLLAAYPSVTVSLGDGGAVLEATARWADIGELDVFRLRDAADAWFEVESGGAYFEAELAEAGAPPGSDVLGRAQFTDIEIAYTTAGRPGGRQYLEPVFAFAGHLTLAGQSTSHPVTAYVPALPGVGGPVGLAGHGRS